ncbi:hypothetical protein BCV72DRAFT_234735 [Rhizopus microsporus var. microsporus]|uniref:Uncharacterized protein n=1 Tax=Rhizopus microsporus var. microsporus TaxID=86635 RepID=A0A1X0QRL4_RHIZD|nr:hypothetical protein BCV72DRAFT_234735 [Rhizopus microsporus var. microsporus]
MSKTNLQLLKSLADEEQELYLNVCRARIRQLNEVKVNLYTHIYHYYIIITIFML